VQTEIGILAAAVIAAAAAAAPAAAAGPTLNDIASAVAGKSTAVICRANATPHRGPSDRSGGATAVATIPGADFIAVDTTVCAAVVFAVIDPTGTQLRASRLRVAPASPAWEAWGLLVVAREAAHARGIVDDTDAECEALSWLPTVLKLLGVPSSRRAVLAAAAVAAHRAMPAPFRTHPCDGGVIRSG
jgi:hypothetical protein